MNLQSILTGSKNFYRSHDLASWANALPLAIKLSKEAEAQMAHAEKLGLEQALVFPDFKTLMASPELLIAQRFWREIAAAQGIEPKSKELGKFYWVWVVDSGDKENCCAVFYSLQGAGMYGCKIGSANKMRGANVTVVVPL